MQQNVHVRLYMLVTFCKLYYKLPKLMITVNHSNQGHGTILVKCGEVRRLQV